MKKFISKSKILAFMLCTVLLVTYIIPAVIYAVTQDDLDDANSKLEELRRQQSALSSEYSQLNSQLDDITKEIAALDNRINSKQAEINKLNSELTKLDDEIDKQYASMKLRIKYMYEAQSSNTLELLFSADNFADMLTRAEYIMRMSAYDRNMLTTMEETLAKKQEVNDTLTADMAELVELRSQATAKADNLKNLMASKKNAINESNTNIKKAEELALEYEKAIEEQRLKEQLEQIKNNSGSSSGSNSSGGAITYDANDLAMLAAIIECEAGNQPYEGLIAVGSVIINRVRDTRFANTISGVIFSPGQFSPVASGRFAIVLSRGATDRCVQAAGEVLNGRNNTNALYFHRYRPELNENGTIIGDHIFI